MKIRSRRHPIHACAANGPTNANEGARQCRALDGRPGFIHGAAINRNWQSGPGLAASWLTALVVCLAGLAGIGGCKPEGPPPGAHGPVGGLEAQGVTSQDILRSALYNLNHLEEFSSGEMLQQIVERFNQWIAEQEPPSDWKPDPLVAGLPEQLREMPQVKNLAKLEFPREDAFTMQEAVWLRDLSSWARGNTLDPLEQARKLFDWTVRNIQFDPSKRGPDGRPLERVRQIPWETLLLGHGTPLDRAWIFILLARQQGIDACVIALPNAEGQLRTWAVAVRCGEELYLFDTALGLPIPAPGEIKLGADGQLDIRPATLSQLVADDALLRRLDLDAKRPYPVKAADLKKVIPLLAGSPSALSLRMEMLQNHLAGADKMVLTAAPTAQSQRLEKITFVGPSQLWTLPYTTILQRTQMVKDPDFATQQMLALMPFQVDPSRSLFKGRVMHLKGKLRGDEGAAIHYQRARPPDSQIGMLSSTDKEQRLTKEMLIRAKRNASYWLGLVSHDLGNYRTAIDYFANRTLKASPGGPWTPGARYNLGRAYEAAGRAEEAIAQYEADPQTPGYRGAALRARWLRATAAVAEKKEKPKPEADGGEEKEEPAAPKSDVKKEETPKAEAKSGPKKEKPAAEEGDGGE